MNIVKTLILGLIATVALSCGRNEGDALDFDFVIPRTEMFLGSIEEYKLFIEPLADLQPKNNVHPYQLNSELFTDYASKQRLMRLPAGKKVTVQNGQVTYPEGTLLAKTFYFNFDLNDPSKGRKIVETRLLIKREEQWNVATYKWNEEQTNAYLILDGSEVEVSFMDKSQTNRQTRHQIPSEVACVTCHQKRNKSIYIGPSIKNLDRDIEYEGTSVKQLDQLATLGLFPANQSSSSTMVNYYDESQSLSNRARSYLDINCAHCHNPKGWSRPAQENLDLHYETTLSKTGISGNLRALKRNVQSGEMPFIGTTLKHTEGIELLISYFDSL